VLPALLVSVSLVLSPWPGSVPATASPIAPASTPPSAAVLASPFVIAPEAPAPTPSLQRQTVPRHSVRTTYTTTTVTKAPEPPFHTIAYNRPYPESRAYSARERKLMIAGATLTLASIVPAVFTIRAAVQLARTRDRFFATPEQNADRRFALQREGLRQANIVIVVGLATILLSTTALVLFGLARRKRHRDTPKATSRPCPADPTCVLTSTDRPRPRRAA
jgi:hypothetical protein